MRRFSFHLFFMLLTCLLQAQSQLTVSGTVTRISDGSPVADWFVLAYGGDPADSTVFVFGSGITGQDGNYSFAVDIPPGISNLTVSTFNGCNNDPIQLEQQVSANTGQATADFQICADVPVTPDCEAWFWYFPGGGLTIDYQSDFYALDGAAANSYSWDFGDGTTGSEANPSHTYTAEGIYTVTLTVTSETGCTATYSEQVFVFDQPPFPDCWAWIDFQPTGDSLTFSFSAQYYNGLDTFVTADSYLWDFGDGSTSTDVNPTHTYAAEGFYVVQVTVTGADGCVAIAQFPFSTDFPPIPDCSSYISYFQTGTTSFDFSAFVYNANGATSNIIDYAWDFGDGNTSNEANPSHTYDAEGIYTVQLTALTEDSCESHSCVVVFAYDMPVDTFWYGCQAMFAAGYGWGPNGNPAGGDPLTIAFYDLSLGAVQSWAWDFGDGSTSTEQNPLHTYAEEGFYTVTLSITTIDGCESTASYSIYAGDDFPWTPEPDCQAMFIPLPDSIGSSGIQFIDLSYSPNPIQNWSWNFGDGTTSNEQNPYHVYAQPGTYTVSLEIEADSCNSVISFELDTQNPWDFNREPAQLGLAGTLTGVEEHPVFDAVKLYPNPVHSELNAAFSAEKAGDYELRITDLSGKMLVRLHQRAESGSNVARLNVAQLTPGFYLAELRSSDRVQTFKFVKE
ncbi:MAG: PKD domain-containing protein [Haliscomenobacteraceae bacterium CHB4]|nr:PKD domain-containing protein [Haliscomenobacteraceae bacterium CHB4]